MIYIFEKFIDEIRCYRCLPDGKVFKTGIGSGKGLGRILRGWRWLRTGTGKLEGVEVVCWEVRRGCGRGLRGEKRLGTGAGRL